jgi:hypothetical protein
VIVELDEEGRVTSEETISSRLVHHGDKLKVGWEWGACVDCTFRMRVGGSHVCDRRHTLFFSMTSPQRDVCVNMGVWFCAVDAPAPFDAASLQCTKDCANVALSCLLSCAVCNK